MNGWIHQIQSDTSFTIVRVILDGVSRQLAAWSQPSCLFSFIGCAVFCLRRWVSVGYNGVLFSRVVLSLVRK